MIMMGKSICHSGIKSKLRHGRRVKLSNVQELVQLNLSLSLTPELGMRQYNGCFSLKMISLT